MSYSARRRERGEGGRGRKSDKLRERERDNETERENMSREHNRECSAQDTGGRWVCLCGNKTKQNNAERMCIEKETEERKRRHEQWRTVGAQWEHSENTDREL